MKKHVHTHKTRSGKSSHSHKHVHAPSASSKDLLADQYKNLKAGKPVIVGHATHGKMPHESIREVEYKGHNIIIRTSYDIKIDGKPLHGHVYVDRGGMVSTHAMPTYSFASTVDLVKKLIDAFPTEFDRTKGRP